MRDHRCGRMLALPAMIKCAPEQAGSPITCAQRSARSDAVSFIATSDVVSLARLRDSTVSLQGPALVSLIYFLGAEAAFYIGTLRSEERRVGKECRSRWSRYLYTN